MIVANRLSHANTPALIAAFPTPDKPDIVAADDYWFEKQWDARLLRLAIGAVPLCHIRSCSYALRAKCAPGSVPAASPVADSGMGDVARERCPRCSGGEGRDP